MSWSLVLGLFRRWRPPQRLQKCERLKVQVNSGVSGGEATSPNSFPHMVRLHIQGNCVRMGRVKVTKFYNCVGLHVKYISSICAPSFYSQGRYNNLGPFQLLTLEYQWPTADSRGNLNAWGSFRRFWSSSCQQQLIPTSHAPLEFQSTMQIKFICLREDINRKKRFLSGIARIT